MKLNEVIEEKYFMDKIEELKSQFNRIYEIKDAIIWVLARAPESGTPLPYDPNHRVYETSPLDTEASKFWVLYRLDKENRKIYLLSIAFVPYKDEE